MSDSDALPATPRQFSHKLLTERYCHLNGRPSTLAVSCARGPSTWLPGLLREDVHALNRIALLPPKEHLQRTHLLHARALLVDRQHLDLGQDLTLNLARQRLEILAMVTAGVETTAEAILEAGARAREIGGLIVSAAIVETLVVKEYRAQKSW